MKNIYRHIGFLFATFLTVMLPIRLCANDGTPTECEMDSIRPRGFILKSNLAEWVMAMPNLGAEYDISAHFSVALTFQYAGWDYFKPTIKFRNLTVMPEVRYWPSLDNTGFFVEAHLGIAWYDIAWGGSKRYKNHKGSTPAIGGGISLGYRFPLKSPHWNMEVSAGVGAYKIDYDEYHNRNNGALVKTCKATYLGLDQASISICYAF